MQARINKSKNKFWASKQAKKQANITSKNFQSSKQASSKQASKQTNERKEQDHEHQPGKAIAKQKTKKSTNKATAAAMKENGARCKTAHKHANKKMNSLGETHFQVVPRRCLTAGRSSIECQSCCQRPARRRSCRDSCLTPLLAAP
jgi:hypothetical protein